MAESLEVLHATLVDLACNQPRRLIADHLVKSAQANAETISDLLLRAYTEGLAHGFQQGVQAEAHGRRETP